MFYLLGLVISFIGIFMQLPLDFVLSFLIDLVW